MTRNPFTVVLGVLLNINHNHCSKKLNQHTEFFFNLDDYINANFNYESLRSRLVSNSYHLW